MYGVNFGIASSQKKLEPDLRSVKAKGTRIIRTDGKPLAISGLWASCKNPEDNKTLHNFTMLTYQCR